MPRWHPVSISGYHIREAGATAVQELAFTLADGIGYVRGVRRRAGIDVDDFAPRLSFFFDVHNDFFEEIAKFRAARRIWAPRDARALRREEPALAGCCARTRRPPACRSPRSSRSTTWCASRCRRWPRCSAARSRCTPTRSTRPRAAHRGGGARSRCARSRSSPRRRASTASSIRSAAATSSRPSPTRWRSAALDYIRRIDEMGGIVRAIEEGYPQKEIAESAYRYQREVEQGERLDRRRQRASRRDERRADRAPARSTTRSRDEQVERAAQVKAERDAGGASQARARRGRGAPRRGDGQPDAAGARGGEGRRARSARSATSSARCSAMLPRPRVASERAGPRSSASSSPSPASTATTAAPRSSRARCATPASR